jgi:hypothetical protein
MVLYFISTLVLDNLGFDHSLYQYAGGIGVPLSDMNGQGDFARFNMWFDLYWTALAVIMVVLAYALWRREPRPAMRPGSGVSRAA